MINERLNDQVSYLITFSEDSCENTLIAEYYNGCT